MNNRRRQGLLRQMGQNFFDQNGNLVDIRNHEIVAPRQHHGPLLDFDELQNGVLPRTPPPPPAAPLGKRSRSHSSNSSSRKKRRTLRGGKSKKNVRKNKK